jgi:hypothetical protein
MDNQPFSPPSGLYSKTGQAAPTITISEDDGRRGGYYGDSDEETRGYRAVLVYIQKGLGSQHDLVRSVVRLILKAQRDAGIKWALVPLSFGWEDGRLHHEKKYFDLGPSSGSIADSNITETILRISGTDPSSMPAVIPELYPRADIRSLYGGKTRVDEEDLLVVIGIKDEVCFAEQLRNRITNPIRKHILFVEISESQANWIFDSYHPTFDSIISEGESE